MTHRSRRRLLQLGALVLLVGLAVGLVLALVHRPAGGKIDLGGRALAVRSELTPREAQFGDTVVARVDVFAERGRVDPDSIRVRSGFAPYRVAATNRSTRTIGGVSVVRVETVLRCLDLPCVPRRSVAAFRFLPARVSYREGAAARTIRAGWPALRVRSRVTKAEVARPVLRVPPPVAAPSRYRLSPNVAGYTLLALAGLLAAGGAAVLLIVGLRRVAPARRRAPRLERLLGELAESCSNGDSGRRRRTLEELARELEPLDEPLSIESRVLAWGPRDPQPETISDLTGRVRTAVRP